MFRLGDGFMRLVLHGFQPFQPFARFVHDEFVFGRWPFSRFLFLRRELFGDDDFIINLFGLLLGSVEVRGTGWGLLAFWIVEAHRPDRQGRCHDERGPNDQDRAFLNSELCILYPPVAEKRTLRNLALRREKISLYGAVQWLLSRRGQDQCPPSAMDQPFQWPTSGRCGGSPTRPVVHVSGVAWFAGL